MSNNQTPWSAFSGPNLGYVMEQYDLFLQSPDEVDSELVSLFQQYGAPTIASTTSSANVATSAVEPNNFEKVIRAIQLADAIRAHGHLTADIYPLNDGPKEDSKIDPKTYGLTDQDLREVPVSFLITNAPSNITNGLQAIEHLKAAYTNKIAFEIAHIVNTEEKLWLQEKLKKVLF